MKVMRHEATVKADVATGRVLDSEKPGQRFLPTKVKVCYVADEARRWRVLTIMVTGPIVRKRDGGLSSREGYLWFSAGAGTLMSAPGWATRLANASMPGGGAR